MKRLTALLLTFVMIMNMLPVQAFAADVHTEEGTETIPVIEEVQTEETTDPADEMPQEETPPVDEPRKEPQPVEQTTQEITETVEETTQPEPEQIILTEQIVLNGSVTENLPSNFDMLKGYTYQQTMGIQTLSTAGYDQLNAAEQQIYKYLRAKIADVAENGGSTIFSEEDFSTFTELKVLYTAAERGLDVMDEAARAEVQAEFKAQFDFGKIVTALLHDQPLNCYWLDKTAGYSMSYSVSMYGYKDADGNIMATQVEFVSPVITFKVSKVYTQDGDINTVSSDMYTSWATADAAANAWVAQAIQDYATDYDRLQYFKDRICSETSYNHDAADAGNFTDDANPWQIIEVLYDTDAEGVVCEGYSKTFQFLCDKLSEEADVGFTCYTVTGEMIGATGSGGHMWNVVTMDDGRNYIVDVTNCDSGSIGQNGELFMAPAAGSVASGYTVTIDSTEVVFEYDTDILLPESVLTISSTEYEKPRAPLASGSCGTSASWAVYDIDLDGTGDRLVISGSGAMNNLTSASNQPWYSYNTSIKNVTIESGVTTIGNYAFKNCSALESISIPDSVTYLGSEAFYGCQALERINIPASVTSVGNNALAYCPLLEELTLHPALTNIGENVIAGTAIKTIYFTGTQDQWNAITIADTNAKLYAATINFNACASDHIWVDATCALAQHCSVCNAIKGSPLEHTPGAEPTCTTPQICTVCNAELAAALGHSYESTVTPAGCTTEGYTTYICTVCEYIHKDNYTAATGHTAGAAATCTAPQVCTVCDTVITAALGHTEVVDAAVAPDCENTGLTEGRHCSVCDKVIVKQETVAALGHTEVIDAAVAPDCENTGLTEGKHCSVCDEVIVKQEVVAATGHAEVIDAAVAPDCVNTGLTEGKHCSVCDKVIVKQEVVAATGHTEVIDAAVAPGCETTGLTEGRHCSVCDKVIVKQEVVSALGHTEVVDAAVAPDCVNTGLTEGRHCSVCGKVIVKQEVTEAAGHSYEATVVPSTCLEKGHTDYTCSVCGDTYRDEYTDYADHTPGDFIADGNGYRQAQCTVCGETITEKDKVHSGNDWYIDSANTLFVESEKVMEDEDYYDYKEIIEKVVIAEGIETIPWWSFSSYEHIKEAVLPSTVKTVGAHRFYMAKSLDSVNFPMGLEKIYSGAFSLTNLNKIVLPSSVQYLDDQVFTGISALTEIHLGNSLTFIGESLIDTDKNISVYYDGSYKEFSDIAENPDSWLDGNRLIITGHPYNYSVDEDTGEATFTAMHNAGSTLEIPAEIDGYKITAISANCQSNSTAVAKVIIPASVTAIGADAFSGCSNLTEIEYLGNWRQWNNISINSSNAVLNNAKITVTTEYTSSENADGEIIITGAGQTGGKIEIPAAVNGKPVTAIAEGAFADNADITSVIIPDSVTTIGRNAFSGCDSLTEVAFDGSWQNWTENVSVGSGNDIDDIITFAQPWKYVQVSDGIRLTAHYTNTGYIDIPAEIDGYKVTVVGANLFLNQSGVTGVSFPETVHTIERNAFYNTALTKVDFSQGLVTIGDSAFYNALMFSYEYDTDIILPEGLKTIEKYAFGYTDYRHYYNSELYVPSSVETIGTGAFGYRFAKATYDGTLQQWVDIYGPSVTSTLSGNLAPADTFIAEDDGSAVFTRKYDYNGNMLDEYALVSWTGATGDVTVPSRFRNMPVTMAGRNTFYKNTSVTSVILPESVKQIDYDMFYGCTALEEVHILGNIEGNLSGTFSGCTALKKVTLPGTVSYIGSSTFMQCINLEEVHYPSSWNWYNRVTVDATGNDRLTDDVMVFEHDWGYVLRTTDTDKVLALLGCTDASGDIVIPAYIDGYPVKYIESYYNSSTDSHIGAFEGNTEITSVVIPEGVTNISVRTFKYCTALESVVIPASVKEVNCQMFEGCTNLKEITICGKDTYISQAAQYLPAGVKFNIVSGGSAENSLKNQGITNINRTVMLESLSAADVRVALGGMASLPKVSKVPADASGQLDIVWSVADETVAQLTDNGGKQMIQAVSVGVTELTATDRNTGKYTIVKVNVVLPAGENMSLEPDSPIDRIGLENGDVRTITISSPSAGIIPADRLVFTSSNTAAVQVSADGVITSVYTGTGAAKATITAALASDSGEKVTLEVKAIARQTKAITLVPEIPQEYKDRISIIYDEDTLIQTVIVPRDLVKDGNLPFEIKAVGQDKDGNDFAPNVKWTTSDAKVAKIRAVKGATDTATATVLKNVDGITIITATANDMAKAQGILEIDVRDYTPRLETGSVTINTNRTAGAVIPLYTAYDALLESYSPMQLMALEGETRVTNVQLTGNDAFYALYDSENSTITINTDEIVKNATYTLTLHISTAKGETQQTVKVKVANKLPKITLKQTDTFNLFFKDSTADVAVTAAGAVVNSVQLTDCDTFAVTGYENGVFTLAYADSDNPLNGYVSGKADTKAGLKVWLEGYKEAVVVKAFTIKAKETKPGLALSRKSTAYSWLNSENLPLNVIHTVDKNTKVALDFAEYTVSADGSAGFVQLTAAGTDIMLDTLLTSGNKFIDSKTAHTVNLAVNHANWVKPMVLAHKITVNSALPTVKATPATLTMKSLYNSTVSTVLVPSVANCPAPARYEITPVNAAQAEQTAKISISSSGWIITAAFADLADLPANGSYKYNVVPVVADESGTEHSLKAVTITVAVNNTLPKIKAEKTTVTLNGAVYSPLTETALKADAADCPVPTRYEIKAVNAAQQAEIDKLTVYADGWTLYTGFADINNLPANGSYKLAVTAYITNAQGGETALAPVTVTVKVATATPKVTLSKTAVTLSSSLLEDYVIPFRVTEGYVLDNVVVTNGSGNLLTPADISVSFDSLAQAMVVKVNNKALAAGKYKYVLTPVVKLADETATAQTMVKAINLTVTTQAKTPVLKTGAKGSIDAANRGTGITYTITGGTNFNYPADEILTDSFCLTGADADKFDIRYAGVNSKGQHMVTVTAKTGAQLATNVKYSYAVQVQVSGMASPVETATFKVGVKQTALKFITAGQTTVYHSYTGTSFFNISVKTPAGAQIGNVQLLDTKATTVPAGALDYTISQNPDGSWKVSYTVERAALLKAGKSYKLAFAITPEGNATNKAPQTLSVTLKIKR